MTNEAEEAVCMCVYKCVREPDFKGHCRECGAAFDGHRAAVFTHIHTHKQTNSSSNSRQTHGRTRPTLLQNHQNTPVAHTLACVCAYVHTWSKTSTKSGDDSDVCVRKSVSLIF